MTRIRLPYVHAFLDRHGKPRHYFRRGDCPKTALPGIPGSTEFMEAYRAALDGNPVMAKNATTGRKSLPGTMNALILDYYASTSYLALRPSSKRAYRGILEAFRVRCGSGLVAELDRKNVRRFVAEKAATPSAANNLLGTLRTLMNFAIDEELRDDNPTMGVKRLKVKRGGFHSWTDEEIAQFEACHPIGTRARLAFALHLYTGQRRSDVIKMTWRDISGESIRVTQVKTGSSLRIKLHPYLRAVLNAAPRDHISLITTKFGAPFTPEGYGAWFGRMTDKAGLPFECASHGLRKAAARRLAEAGCSASEIAAITGHASLHEVSRYTRGADQGRLGDAAILKLGG